MSKIKILTIIMSISIVLSGCSNIEKANNQNIVNDKNVVNNQNTVDNSNNSNIESTKITIDQAKEIALKHANLTSDQVSFIKSDKEMDDLIEIYDIEFYHENKEYDYEISVDNGDIIKYDYDIENYNISKQQEVNEASVEITLEDAKEIALKHANLTSDKVEFGKLEMDFDNGIKKYDIEFYFNNKEYSYEIDANTGSILSYEQD